MPSGQTKVSVPQIRLPKGGGAIKGIGETFQPASFTGTLDFSIPISTPTARGLEPDLQLTYSSGSSQGAFGMGFNIAVPNIARRTEKRLPTYSEEDEFVLSNAEYLVPELQQNGQDIKEFTLTEAGHDYRIRRYRTRTEGRFLKIERWTKVRNGDVHWRVTTPENILNIFGLTDATRIMHPGTQPDKSPRIFQWLLEETRDSKGNRILYQYKAEDAANIATGIHEQGRLQIAQKYLQTIQYGNYFNEQGLEDWMFGIVFDYGEYDLDQLQNLSTIPSKNWSQRQDPFSDYRAGFEIRTHRLCRNILVFHHFDAELGIQDCLVSALRLTYQESSVLSFLTQVQQVGYRRQSSGEYEIKALPPLAFEYSSYDPLDHAFQTLTVENQQSLPMTFSETGYQLLDLYGEGISGILYDHIGTTLYWRPQGNGQYDLPHDLQAFPIERNQAVPTYALTDGLVTKLTVKTQDRFGWYDLDSQMNWTVFQNFIQMPLEYEHPAAEHTDVTGDGRPDLLLFDTERVKVYPSEGNEGYNPAITALRHHDGPVQQSSTSQEKLLFADMSGDGLSDRVRIRNGQVTYWPNLGYGHFGTPVQMAEAPHFGDQMDADRLFPADIDGSGTTDLVYVESQQIKVYFNESGNRWSEPLIVSLPASYDRFSQVQLADIRGNGTSCFVFSSGTQEIQHQFYDFTGGVKPHLLTRVDNHMGAINRVQYAPSTQFYLADRGNNDPWITRLPFPVQLVAKTETIDLIARSKQVSRYAYHHGAYDLREREFAGFGLVERWDTEAFEQFTTTESAFEILPSELHVPPIHTKTWYHTGLAEREDVLSLQFADEYYQGDGNALVMADSILETPTADPASLREAYRALRGKVLREEVYSLDDDIEKESHPYTVKEYKYSLRLVQPIGSQRYSVYLPLERETITYQYERDPADPRITHQFSLEYDDYGQLTRQAELAYGRRNRETAHPDQIQTQGRYTYREFISPTASAYYLGLPVSEKVLELDNLTATDYFDWQTLADRYTNPEKEARDIDQTALEQPTSQARLLSWKTYFYWNEDEILALPPVWDEGEISAVPVWDTRRVQALPVGEMGPRALLHHVETAVYPQAGIANHLAGSGATAIDLDKLLSATDGDGGAFQLHTPPEHQRPYYVDPGTTAYYGSAQGFYQPTRYVDQFDVETLVKYDAYNLSIARTEARLSDSQSHSQTVQLDYHTLKPRTASDINQNIAEYRYDPLGNVQYISRYGTEGTVLRGDQPLPDDPMPAVPDLQTILNNPYDYLREATEFFYYDTLAFEKSLQSNQQPVYAIGIRRERHSSDLQSGETSPLQFQLDYADGLGRTVQTKQNVQRLLSEGGSAAAESERWLTTGRTVYNNKGLVVKQYEPFYSSEPLYQSERAITEQGVTAVRYYDPLGREIKVDLPKGFLTRTQYQAWRIQTEDANDTIQDSPYYKRNNGNFSGQEQDQQNALDKGVKHANTPKLRQLDVWGRPFRVLESLEAGGTALETYTRLDIVGNPIGLRDARLPQEQFNFQIEYDMMGRPIRQIGIDNGSQWTLYNAGGDEIQRWDGRGFHVSTHYDALGRPITIWVEGNGIRQPVEQITYGEEADPTGNRNQRGQIIAHYDASGVTRFTRYGIDGRWLQREKQLRVNYKSEPDWSQSASPAREPLETEVFTEQRHFDALGQLLEMTHPNGQVIQYRYGPFQRLQSVYLRTDNQTQTLVEAIQYNPRNQRTKIRYGNNTQTTQRYDPETFNLISLKTVRISDNSTLQDIAYTYDPVGNLTRLRDHSHATVFNNNQQIDPLSDYTYDALYRLTQATGRDHPGLYGDRGTNVLANDDLFLPTIQGTNNSQALQNYTRTYLYDDAGNLTQLRHASQQRSFTRDFTVSATSNRGILSPGNRQVDAEAAIKDVYDANGNLTQMDHLGVMLWNYRNQLLQVDIIQRIDAGNDTEYYAYDRAGQRVRKVHERLVNGRIQVDETVYIGNYEVKRTRRDIRPTTAIEVTRHTVHVQETQERLAIVHHWPGGRSDGPDRQFRYQLGNHQGSVALELATDGKMITYEEYYPYGGTALIAGKNQQEVKRKNYRYSGRERDANTQFYYYGARYYAPWLGRWLSPDPAGTVDGLNLYAFVGGNPTKYVDDGGLEIREVPKHAFNPNAEVVNAGRQQPSNVPTAAPGASVKDRVAFFNQQAQASRLAAPSRGTGAANAVRVIPKGIVADNVRFFNATARNSGTASRSQGKSSGATDAARSIPQGIVAEKRARLTGGNGSQVKSAATPDNSNQTVAQGNVPLPKDRTTAILVLAAIGVAVQLRRLMQQKEKLNDEIRNFDRKQLRPVPRLAESAPSRNEAVAGNQPVNPITANDANEDLANVAAGSPVEADQDNPIGQDQNEDFQEDDQRLNQEDDQNEDLAADNLQLVDNRRRLNH